MRKITTSIETFNIQNRKYLGSKANLIAPILKQIIERAGYITSFADIFAGTGVIAEGIRKFYPKTELIVNDTLYSNYIIYQAFFGCREDEINLTKIYDLLDQCNHLKGYYGYVTHNYGERYFTTTNAKKIDEIRDYLQSQYQQRKINFKENCILLTSLLYAIDKCANTCGQYDAYLKHIGSVSFENGIHKVDINVYKPLEMKMPNINYAHGENLIVSIDANTLIEHINPQVIYIDPPYNNRQYIDNYHLLENIARWNKPEVFGKTRKFNRDLQKSRYSQKKYVKNVFCALIKHCKTKHLFVSYNSEGLMNQEEIIAVLSKKGKVSVTEMPYNVFGNGAGQSRKRKLSEYLYYVG